MADNILSKATCVMKKISKGRKKKKYEYESRRGTTKNRLISF
jgi:hypothetical protein